MTWTEEEKSYILKVLAELNGKNTEIDWVAFSSIVAAVVSLVIAVFAIKVSKDINADQKALALEMNRPKLSSSVKYFTTADKILIYVELSNDGNSNIEDIRFNLDLPARYVPMMGWDLYSLRNPDDIKTLEPGQTYLIPWLGFTKNIYRDFYSYNYKPGYVTLKYPLSQEAPIEFSLKYTSNNKVRTFRFDKPLFQLAIEAGLKSVNEDFLTNGDIEQEDFGLIGPQMFRSIHLRGDFKINERVAGAKQKANTETIISFFRGGSTFMCHTKVDSLDRLNIRFISYGGHAVALHCWTSKKSLSELYKVRNLVLNMRTLFAKKNRVNHIKVETVDIELADGSWFRVHVSNGIPQRLSNGSQGNLTKQSDKFLCEYASALSHLLYQEENDANYDENALHEAVANNNKELSKSLKIGLTPKPKSSDKVRI